jgi:hypothetical protein
VDRRRRSTSMMLKRWLVVVLHLCSYMTIGAKQIEHWPKGISDQAIFEYYAKNATVGPKSYQDKTTTHRYQELYGNHLLPLIRKYHKKNQTIKFLEIGLGCDKGKHYGAGIDIWKHIFAASDELWVSDFDEICVDNAIKSGALNGVHSLKGNQEFDDVMSKWVDETKGDFNVIIDDGGHLSQHIIKTFYYMFDKALAPGGYYFIEDMQVNGFFPMETKDGKKIVLMEVIAGWTQEIIFGHYTKESLKGKQVPGYNADQQNQYFDRTRIPLPTGVKSIFCYPEACVLIKCKKNDVNARCQG